jgi:hypothetical protein
MKTIYTVILASGLYTDGQVTSVHPVPVAQVDCVSLAQTQPGAAKCVRVPWPVDPSVAIALPQHAAE